MGEPQRGKSVRHATGGGKGRDEFSRRREKKADARPIGVTASDGEPSNPQQGARDDEHDVGGRDIRVSVVAWKAVTALGPARWMEHGKRLGRLGTGANWWVGDWLRYGNQRFGDRYKLASRLTGYDVQTLMNYAYVASRFDPARRRADVSWSHHAELAAFDADNQRLWLDRVAVDGLSLRDLRGELRRVRKAARLTDDSAASSPPASPETCPTCGQPVARGSERPQ